MSALAFALLLVTAGSADATFNNADPNPLTFGDVNVGATKSASVSMQYFAPDVYPATNVYVTPDSTATSDPQFVRSSNTCGTAANTVTVYWGQSCSLTFRYTPTGGQADATYQFTLHYTETVSTSGGFCPGVCMDSTSRTQDFIVSLSGNGVVTTTPPPPSTQSPVPTSCNGVPATIVGTNGNDTTLVGTRKRDVVSLGAGDDTFNGKGGNDLICGGDGNDALKGGAGKDRLFGEAGNDALKGGSSKDRCDGGDGADAATCEKRANL